MCINLKYGMAKLLLLSVLVISSDLFATIFTTQDSSQIYPPTSKFNLITEGYRFLNVRESADGTFEQGRIQVTDRDFFKNHMRKGLRFIAAKDFAALKSRFIMGDLRRIYGSQKELSSAAIKFIFASAGAFEEHSNLYLITKKIEPKLVWTSDEKSTLRYSASYNLSYLSLGIFLHHRIRKIHWTLPLHFVPAILLPRK